MLALLFASAEAIKIKSEPLEPLDNTCLYVRKDTGIEQPCNAPGNSAWEPDVPLQSAAEMGLSPGYLGSYWFMPGYTGSEGYDLGGIEPSVKDMVTKEIMFDNASAFHAIMPGFPYDRFQCVWAGQFPVEEAGDYFFSTSSDDGSRLWIDDVMVVDNWGLHGARKRTAKVSLNKGWHTVGSEMF